MDEKKIIDEIWQASFLLFTTVVIGVAAILESKVLFIYGLFLVLIMVVVSVYRFAFNKGKVATKK